LVYLSLAQIDDPELRHRLMSIPTTLTLTPEEVRLLTTAGEELARTSPALRRALLTDASET